VARILQHKKQDKKGYRLQSKPEQLEESGMEEENENPNSNKDKKCDPYR
jgi:hypothetical protein